MRRYIQILLIVFSVIAVSCSPQVKPDKQSADAPNIFPDYREVTIPYNIAPLDFKMVDESEGIAAVFEGKNGGSISVKGKMYIEIPERDWTRLLEKNKGSKLKVSVFSKQNNTWIAYKAFTIFVSPDPVDYGIAFRLIAPGYEVYSKMGIYQRELASFKQDAIIENTLITGSCVNCHSFRLTNPDDMSLHIRGKKGGTVLKTGDEIKLLNTKTPKTISNFVYPFWHPGGKYVAYSVNKTRQVFHETKAKRVEVIDAASDIIVYDVDNNLPLYCDQLMTEEYFETFPTFSADGKTLYFCRADARPVPMEYKEVRYDLCSIAFDPATGTFGDKIDTVFQATAIDKSVTFPRPSPDGKFLMFTLVDYGNFSIWHKEADLYLLDLASGATSPLEAANSDDTESYHSWSSNSRWFVFSSRRIDGLYTRPFISHIDENGKAGKPFLIPQKDPDYYEALLYSYNIPEFISKEVELDAQKVEQLANTSGTNVSQRE